MQISAVSIQILDRARMALAFAYLVLYNIVQFFGWSWILVKTVKSVLVDGVPPTDIFSVISTELKVFQTLAILEVVNSAIGLVRSPPVVTALQVASRVYLVWLVTDLVDEAQHSIGVIIYVIAWSITEVVRYSFYALSLIKRPPYFLQWARYSFFIVLYPMGVIGEMITVFSAMPAVKQRRILSLDLPNPANISFSYYYAMILIVLTYLPGFPQLYFYMWSQRRKVLSGDQGKKKKA